MIRKQEPLKLVKVIATCDLCGYERTTRMPESRWEQYPPDWGVVEREGGGHYGLPIHRLHVCPTCLENES